ncbi:uncharacterized protein G2W53_011855 [Senna tora]|uniref:Uncharacterized protein n=1 Tax=Senna tora TaxID=362788 RepID=A0A834WP58_9FABA|nr:uncharacterized protein G2W53_011855 [Senna tora]
MQRAIWSLKKWRNRNRVPVKKEEIPSFACCRKAGVALGVMVGSQSRFFNLTEISRQSENSCGSKVVSNSWWVGVYIKVSEDTKVAVIGTLGAGSHQRVHGVIRECTMSSSSKQYQR